MSVCVVPELHYCKSAGCCQALSIDTTPPADSCGSGGTSAASRACDAGASGSLPQYDSGSLHYDGKPPSFVDGRNGFAGVHAGFGERLHLVQQTSLMSCFVAEMMHFCCCSCTN